MKEWDRTKEDALVACRRHCCLCRKFKGMKIEVHHIVQRSEGGSNKFDNAIPLCFDCHGDMRSYDFHHPKGSKYKRGELKRLRDDFYAFLKENPNFCNQDTNASFERVFKLKRHDIDLLQSLNQMDLRGGLINFLRNHDFSSSFDYDNNRLIHYGLDRISIVPFKFFDSEMNQSLSFFVSELGELSRLLCQETYPSRTRRGFYEVPPEYPQDRFWDSVDKIHDQVTLVIDKFDDLIELGADKGAL